MILVEKLFQNIFVEFHIFFVSVANEKTKGLFISTYCGLRCDGSKILDHVCIKIIVFIKFIFLTTCPLSS